MARRPNACVKEMGIQPTDEKKQALCVNAAYTPGYRSNQYTQQNEKKSVHQNCK